MRRTFIVAPDGTCTIRYQSRDEQFASIEARLRALEDAVRNRQENAA